MPDCDVHSGQGGLLAGFGRPGGLVYIGWMAVALVLGLWPAMIHPRLAGEVALPAMQAVTMGQVSFALVGFPLLALWRLPNRRRRRYWLDSLAEWSGYAVIGLPFYAVGAWFSDAAAADIVRAMICAALFLPLSLAAGAWMDRPALRAAIVIILLMAVFAAPAGCYVVREFLPRFGGAAEAFWRVSPLTFAWESAASRTGRWWPPPTWATLFWPIVGLAAGLARLFVVSPNDNVMPQYQGRSCGRSRIWSCCREHWV